MFGGRLWWWLFELFFCFSFIVEKARLSFFVYLGILDFVLIFFCVHFLFLEVDNRFNAEICGLILALERNWLNTRRRVIQYIDLHILEMNRRIKFLILQKYILVSKYYTIRKNSIYKIFVSSVKSQITSQILLSEIIRCLVSRKISFL